MVISGPQSSGRFTLTEAIASRELGMLIMRYIPGRKKYQGRSRCLKGHLTLGKCHRNVSLLSKRHTFFL